MPWPTTTEFSDAIQNPSVCFRENPELARGEVSVYPSGGRAGMPVVYTGQFACVYKVTTDGKDIAVRCFTREVKDQQLRYSRLYEYLTAALPDPFVGFQYLEHGMQIKGQWYPIVKMDWAEGAPLNRFVEQNLAKPENLRALAARWRGAIGGLRGLGIAHNDLQHGNVVVQDDRLRLVDYDGIFLPDFHGEASPETGHKNYQHPRRSEQNYDAQIDNFPALVVYLSLLALVADSSLWQLFYNDDNLLLTQKDYANPQGSQCLQALKQSPDDTVKELTAQLERYCALPVEQVPDLESILRGDALPQPASELPDPLESPGTYRILLQNQPGNPRPPQPVAPSNTLLKCPKCGLNNDVGLIYCVNPECQSQLSPESRTCLCSSVIPANARFCLNCGRKQGQPAASPSQPAQPTAAPRPGPARPPTSAANPTARKTCPNCRSQLLSTAIFCPRCGTVTI